MEERKPYQRKLHSRFKTGKYAGQTLEEVMKTPEGVNYLKYLYREKYIDFDPVAWDEFLIAAHGQDHHKSASPNLYNRHCKK